MNKNLLTALFVFSSSLPFSQTALGAISLFEVTGAVTFGRGPFAVGDRVVMTFSYDTAATGSVFINTTQDQSSYSGTAQGVGRTDITFFVGSTSVERYSAYSTTGTVGKVNKKLGFGDSFQAGSSFPATNAPAIETYNPSYFKIELAQNSADLYDDVNLPATLDLNDYDDTRGTLYLDNTGSPFASVLFSIDGIQNIPEPSTSFLLLGSICTGLLLHRRRL